jgi:HAD superfamily hydrolase (TIGR01544 family)
MFAIIAVIINRLRVKSCNEYYIKDKNGVSGKINKLCQGRGKKLIVVTDFDHTMTSFRTNRGAKVPQCHDMIEKSKTFTSISGWKEAWDALWARQREERKLSSYDMAKWWERAHSIITKYGLKDKDIGRVLDEYKSQIYIRQGIRDLFKYCKENDIPIVIVSAGITNVVCEILHRERIDITKNVAVCSNEIIFKKDGSIKEFTSPVVHAESKGKIRSLRKGFFDVHKDRTNVVLMGDSICDPRASQNITNLGTCLSVGFLDVPNEDGSYGWRHSPLNMYSDVYDILVPRDGSAHCVFDLIRKITENKK